MPVPPASALRAGVRVNIVLKADQRSGKLTSGHIADVLTRGNHPRGVKVRLQNGKIGRVQSLSTNPAPILQGSQETVGEAASTPTLSTATISQSYESLPSRRRRTDRSSPRRARMGGNSEEVSLPSTTRSLEDYIAFTPPVSHRAQETASRMQSGSTETEGSQENSGNSKEPQQVLQDEFPQLDSALIAAILTDHTTEQARSVLSALS